MADLVMSETDLQSLSAALMLSLKDLEAVQQSFRRMDVNPVGAPPLLEEERTFTITRDDDITALGHGLADQLDQVERVVPTICRVDDRLDQRAQRAK